MHSLPGPFLLTGRLTPALGKPHGTLVPVFIFFLLTSLAFVLFKLSPRLVAKGCVFECVHVCACVFECVYVRICGSF